MEEACDLMYKKVTSPLGTLEVSGCRQGVHGIRLLGKKTLDTA